MPREILVKLRSTPQAISISLIAVRSHLKLLLLEEVSDREVVRALKLKMLVI
jgi:hypothetical protein